MEQSKTLGSKDILVLAVVTVITVFVWIGFGIYREITNKPVASKAQSLVSPLNPTVREDVITKIEASQP